VVDEKSNPQLESKIGKTMYEYHELLKTKSKEEEPKAFTIPISLGLERKAFMYLLRNVSKQQQQSAGVYN
jgi:hypothetical protein